MEKQWKIGVSGVLMGMMLGYAGHGILNRKTATHSTPVRLVTDDRLHAPQYELPLSRTDQLYTPLVPDTLVF